MRVGPLVRCGIARALRDGAAIALLAACADPTNVYVGADRPDREPDSASAAGGRDPLPPAEPAPPVIDAGAHVEPLDAAAVEPDAGRPRAPLDAGAAFEDAAMAIDAMMPPEAGCAPNTADCDGDARNGCEVDTRSDLQHCGGCGRRCHTEGHDALTAACVEGLCTLTCRQDLFGDHDCDHDPDNGCETRLMTDDENCGGCGVVCSCFQGNCL